VRTYQNLTQAYPKILDELLRDGDTVTPRRQETVEIRDFMFRLTQARQNLLWSPARKLNPAYSVAEWLWIASGLNTASSIVTFNRNLQVFSDDTQRFAGAYGPMVTDQWMYAKQCLENDPHTRQAIISIWRPRPGPSKDIPCTMTFQFFRRHGHLCMSVNMRSNDAWLGLPYDVFTFTQLQMMMAAELNLPVGDYTHHVGSMHLYGTHYESAVKVTKEEFSFNSASPALTRPGIPNEVMTIYFGLQCGKGVVFDQLNDLKHWSHPDAYAWYCYLSCLANRLHPGRLQKVAEFDGKYTPNVFDALLGAK